jgi:hypothetical protein
MLLCDAASEANGKLYVLGGGWSMVYTLNEESRTNLGLAIKIGVPWDRTNKAFAVRAILMTEDGEEVDLGNGAVQAGGEVTVGRPPHLKPGTPIDLPIAWNFFGLLLPHGGYRWELQIDGDLVATTPFRVLPAPPGFAPR